MFPEKVTEFGIDVEVIADLVTINPFDFFVDESAECFPFEYSDELNKELQPYLEITDKGKRIKKFIKSLDLLDKHTSLKLPSILEKGSWFKTKKYKEILSMSF